RKETVRGIDVNKKTEILGEKVNVFFQAEDGIRDKLVTGVQTCALPILITMAICRRWVLNRNCGSTHLRQMAIVINVADGNLGPKIGRASCRERCGSRWSPD